ncbi:hypothetical protein LL033_05455 [Clostridium estertheticum]|uniref:hypothetical protein n=1 Tax=Clostridium estertheticum TaxID=238834 RepID=UPI001C0DB53F|nr:hypothetical protein [Clostridium estertheticum]MBU3215697.1 hypothetical protein [Clostridium estertheticum]WAG56687.1 hypothetical protein LL033_05455 [Clostridium estertheticum]
MSKKKKHISNTKFSCIGLILGLMIGASLENVFIWTFSGMIIGSLIDIFKSK